MSKESEALLKKLDILAERISTLTMVIASKPNGEQLNKLLGKKSQKEQIRILKEWNFPNEVIALIIGTTIETVRVTLSKMKTKRKEGRQPRKEEEAKEE
jgi:ABC-type enterobactin transport system permease subunit